MRDHEQRRAGDLSLPVPGPGYVIGASAGDDRSDPGDEAIEGRRAGRRHLHPGIQPAGGLAVLEPGEEPFAAVPEWPRGTVANTGDEAVDRYRDCRRRAVEDMRNALAGRPAFRAANP
jgi:hypothetical protein